MLSAVGSLLVYTSLEMIFLNWTAPFSLDITVTAMDITYCVDVVNSTSSATLHSQCGITETQFTYPLPPINECDAYTFTVTPVNLVGNGTGNSVQYSLTLPSGSTWIELEITMHTV